MSGRHAAMPIPALTGRRQMTTRDCRTLPSALVAAVGCAVAVAPLAFAAFILPGITGRRRCDNAHAQDGSDQEFVHGSTSLGSASMQAGSWRSRLLNGPEDEPATDGEHRDANQHRNEKCRHDNSPFCACTTCKAVPRFIGCSAVDRALRIFRESRNSQRSSVIYGCEGGSPRREDGMSEAEVALVLVIVGFVALLISIARPIDMSR
jgi:hypothetical protein